MAQRYGRKQKRAAREREANLVEAVESYAHQLRQANREAERLRARIEANSLPLAEIMRDARASIASLTAKALIEAENEFLRDALAQLRRQGGSSAQLDVSPPRPRRLSSPVDDEESAVLFTVTIPPIYRQFAVAVPRVRRRA